MNGRATPLRTGRLDLEPLDPDRDAESLHAMLGDPEFDPYGSSEPTRDVAETRERLAKDLTENGGWTWAVRLRPDRHAIGTIGLFSDQGTSIRGLTWYLCRTYWGRGIMSEAAPVVVDHLLAQPGITGVEAWIDSRNSRSLGVARSARLQERSRMARVYDDHTAQQIVLARAPVPTDIDVVAVRVNLDVHDVRATARLLTEALGLSLAFEYPDPPRIARLAVAQWAGSPGIDLMRATGEIVPTSATIDLGVSTDRVYERVLATGLEVDAPPEDQPWFRRTFTVLLPEGHRLRVHGPLRPEREH